MLRPWARPALLTLAALLSWLPPAAAQFQVQDPAQAYGDLVLTRRLAGLKLTRGQADRILPLLGAVAAGRQDLDAAERKYNAQVADDAVALEWALVRGTGWLVQQQAQLTDAADRHAKERQALAAAEDDAMAAVWAVLTPAQQSMVETAAAAFTRQAWEEAAARNRDAAMKLAAPDLGGWCRAADDQTFAAQASAHVWAVVKANQPEKADADLLPAAQALLQLYSYARRLTPEQYTLEQSQLLTRTRNLLYVPPIKPAGTQLMTAEEWRALLESPRTTALLSAIYPALPTGAAP
jgi:hypothetical protein